MDEAARRAGAPAGAINWMTTVTLEGTQELMKHRDVAVILATGGMGLVRAAYSAGKPAYGVGPGNAPAFIERTANVRKAVRDVVTGKTFDNGVLCSSENSVVVDEADRRGRRSASSWRRARYFLIEGRDGRGGAACSSRRSGCPTRRWSARSADVHRREVRHHACLPSTRVLHRAARRRRPRLSARRSRSSARSSPIYVVRDWREGCERCKQILRYGGMGHTMSIHSQNEQVILEFGLKKPAYRIVVNSPTTHGSDRADDRPRSGHDARLRRLRRQHHVGQHLAAAPAEHQAAGLRGDAGGQPMGRRPSARAAARQLRATRLSAPARPAAAAGISADALTQADRRSSSAPRGYGSGHEGLSPNSPPVAALGADLGAAEHAAASSPPLDFVCEDDVRAAIQAGRQLVARRARHRHTAAARPGEQHRIFTVAPWRG